jgi:hypothetical protein
MAKDMTWQVWGSGREPLLDNASEKGAKEYVEATPEDQIEAQGLYISNEQGQEFYLDPNGEWVEE